MIRTMIQAAVKAADKAKLQNILATTTDKAIHSAEQACHAGFAAKNLAQMTGLISYYLAKTSLGKLSVTDQTERLLYFTRSVSEVSKTALKTMNFELKVVGYNPELMAERNFLMVSNHISYVDILVASSVLPTVFVTSVDLGEGPFLGTMAELGGSIFVERRHRGQIGKDLSVIAETLKAGFNVMLYPEGTSSNGTHILPFKKSLFMSAIEAGCDILPVCLKYTEIDGEPYGLANCDKVAWYGPMKFTPHFLSMMGLKSVKAELHFLDPISVTKDATRQELASKTRAAIEAAFSKTGQGAPAKDSGSNQASDSDTGSNASGSGGVSDEASDDQILFNTLSAV